MGMLVSNKNKFTPSISQKRGSSLLLIQSQSTLKPNGTAMATPLIGPLKVWEVAKPDLLGEEVLRQPQWVLRPALCLSPPPRHTQVMGQVGEPRVDLLGWGRRGLLGGLFLLRLWNGRHGSGSVRPPRHQGPRRISHTGHGPPKNIRGDLRPTPGSSSSAALAREARQLLWKMGGWRWTQFSSCIPGGAASDRGYSPGGISRKREFPV